MRNTECRVGRASWTVALLALLAATTLSSCNRSDDALILQREWVGNAEYAGDIWASDLAAERGMTLEVREGSEVIDPIRMVRSGKAHFGVASADRVLRENESGAGLVVIAAATHRSPVVFLTQESLRIDTPDQFRGRTVGLQAGTNTELLFRALADAHSIPLTEVKVVESGWGTATFETGTIDVLGAFAYDEPVSLQQKERPFGTISPEDFGIHYIGTVYFARKDFAAENPDIVQSFVDLLVEGWTRALADPDAAIEKLALRFETVRNNREKERKSLQVGRPFFEGDEGYLLFSAPSRWEAMAQSLINLGEIKKFDFNENVDYKYLMAASR